MNMIEKVAVAIGGLDQDRCNPCTTNKILKCTDCLKQAKAAIEAMKEPTEEMIEAGDRWCNDYGTADMVFKDMIEAALKD